MQSALERTREAAAALPAGEEKTANDFMRFSHLWTRPLPEALQVCQSLQSFLEGHQGLQRYGASHLNHCKPYHTVLKQAIVQVWCIQA